MVSYIIITNQSTTLTRKVKQSVASVVCSFVSAPMLMLSTGGEEGTLN